jgi:Cys-tRNA(Pro)/Cys-tRNA(Cys) deacylase
MKRGATPATTILERAGVAFTVHEYTHDATAPAFGLEAAAALALPEETVFKTLLARVDGTGYAVAMVPVAQRLNLKALAAAAGGKRAEMALPAEAERLTGYVVGGISPLGQKRGLPTFLDASAQAMPVIYVSGGRRGLDIGLAPADLLRLTGGQLAPLTN